MSRFHRHRHVRNAPRPWLAFSVVVSLALAGSARSAEPEPDTDPNPDDDSPAQDIGAVSVTATRATREVMDTPGNVTVIDREQIERSGAGSIPDLLRRQSGISVLDFTTNPAGFSVEARGFQNGGSAGSSLLVLVDGVRANEADNGITDWGLLSLDRVERIEIVRGPTSALYGDNAVGGVIQIFTRPEPGPLRGTIRGAAGSYDSGRASLQVTGTTGPATLTLLADGLTTEGYRDRAFYRRGSIQGSAQLDLGKRVEVGVSGGAAAYERRFPGTLFSFEKDALGRRAASPRSSKDGGDVDRQFVQGWLRAVLAEDVTLRVQPHFHHRDEEVVITSLVFGTTDIGFDKDAVGVDAQFQIDRPLGPLANRLIAGGEFLRETTRRDILSVFGPFDTNSRRNLMAFFVQDELNLTENWILSGGVRFDQAWYRLEVDSGLGADTDDPNFTLFSPKGALTYRITEPVAVYVSYSRGFRLPNYDENSPIEVFEPPDFARAILNPDLDEQRSDSYEIGIKYDSKRVQASVSYYYMRVKDELVFNPLTFLNENFDRVDHHGIEAGFEIRPLDWLSLYGTYTYEDVRIKEHDIKAFEGQRMPINPLHRGTVGVLADLPYSFEAGWNANVVGKRGLSNDFTHKTLRLDTYALHDLHVAFRPTLPEHVEAALTFALRNLTGRKYSDFGTRNPTFVDPDGGPFVNAFNPAATRSWEIGFSLTVRR